MKPLVFLILMISLSVPAQAAQTKLFDTATQLFLEISKTIFPVSKSRAKNIGDFSTKACHREKKKWLKVVYLKQSFDQTIPYSQDCDLEGSFSPKVDQEFSATFNIRDLKSVTNVTMNMKINVATVPQISIHFKCLDGMMKTDSGTLTFKADYSVVIDPMDQDFIKQNKGGYFEILTLAGKDVAYKKEIHISEKRVSAP